MSDADENSALKDAEDADGQTRPIRQRGTGADRAAPPHPLPRRGYSHSPSFAPKDDLRKQIAELTAMRQADEA